MPGTNLKEQNATLLKLLEQAGLDSKQRDIAARVQTVLTNELHHRMKNMLTMVTAIVRQSLRSASDLAQAEAAIGARLVAMAKAHDVLLKSDWQAADLATVVRAAIEQHCNPSGRIVMQGEALQIASAAILPLSLLFNELCTNATKYGALSKDDGAVTISWTRDAANLALRWVESGGPPVVPPRLKSFGTRLIENGIPRQLGGTGLLSFPPSGVVFELTLPLARLRPLGDAG
ncbi:MAG: sensor histidine kinase [Pseudomonadota bacterium]